MEDNIKFTAGEDPYVVVHGGFYRRWLPMLSNHQELIDTVKKITTTTEETWIPIWQKVAKHHEDIGNDLLSKNNTKKAYEHYMNAKTFLSIARYNSY